MLYYKKDGAACLVKGLYSDSTLLVDSAGQMVNSFQATFEFRPDRIAPPRMDDRIKVREVLYRVADHHTDSTGTIKLMLQKVKGSNNVQAS